MFDVFDAALFTIVDGYLRNNGLYVGSNGSVPYDNMRRYIQQESVLPGWSIDSNGFVMLRDRVSSDGSADFCVKSDGSVILEMTEDAPGCADVDLTVIPGMNARSKHL